MQNKVITLNIMLVYIIIFIFFQIVSFPCAPHFSPPTPHLSPSLHHSLSPALSLDLTLSFHLWCPFCQLLSPFLSSVCVVTPPPSSSSSPHLTSLRESSLAAFCSLFAANGPLVCWVQGNKSHQARSQAPWLPHHVGQSGQFAMVWWAAWIWDQ